MAQGRVIAIASQKGGVGKTTTAVNLAASLALAGQDVVLVDLDPQGNATSGLGTEALGGALLEVPGGRAVELSPMLRDTAWNRLRVIPSSPRLADVELQHRAHTGGIPGLRRAVRTLTQRADFVLIDCPPSLGVLPYLGMAVSDSVLVPVQCEYFAMEGLSKTLPEIERVRQRDNPEISVEGLLLTMYSPEVGLACEVADEVRAYFPQQVYRTVIPRDVVLAEAASHGKPALDYDVKSRGAWAYARLAKEVLHHDR